MVNYLLNATIIWLLGLLVFDLVLRRQPRHKANRAWLLGALLLGVALPALPWQPSLSDDSVISRPLYTLTRARETIETGITPGNAEKEFDWLLLLEGVYLAGAFFSIARLFREVVVLARYYRNGKKQSNEGWIIVETGKEHGPFSLFGRIFISSKDHYDDAGWEMIVQHERAHGKLRHSADMLLLQVLQIVFWFHPLVYLYRRRLLMVHEYQADAAVITSRKAYGSFLLEQAMLGSAPALTHSFHHSPIKNRIRMLTNKTSRSGAFSHLLALPFLFISVAICSQSHSQVAKEEKLGDNKIRFKGNIIEFSKKTPPDTVEMTDPTTGDIKLMVWNKDPYPIAVNGEKIYEEQEISQPVVLKGNESLEENLLESIRDDISQLGDGHYSPGIVDMIVDKKGNLAYYKVNGLLGRSYKGTDDKPAQSVVDERIKKKVDAKVIAYLNRGKDFTPARVGGKAVAAMIEFRKNFVVKDHQVTLE